MNDHKLYKVYYSTPAGPPFNFLIAGGISEEKARAEAEALLRAFFCDYSVISLSPLKEEACTTT